MERVAPVTLVLRAVGKRLGTLRSALDTRDEQRRQRHDGQCHAEPAAGWFAAEVVQTSAMDCGPAALKCLLEGFGIPVSYGRLREACQTDVDGTSIDTLEEVAVQLGLDAEQVMVPVDHLLLPEADSPARHRGGPPGQRVHPLRGRLAPPRPRGAGDGPRHRAALADLHALPGRALRAHHAHPRRRLARLGGDGRVLRHPAPALGASWGSTRPALAARALAAALDDPDWRPLATLDATTRMVNAMVRAGGLRRGRQATRLFEAFYERARQEAPDATQTIPEAYWTVRPAPPGPDGEAHLLLRGAVLVRVRGRRLPYRAAAGRRRPQRSPGEPAPLSPELVAALAEPPQLAGARTPAAAAR